MYHNILQYNTTCKSLMLFKHIFFDMSNKSYIVWADIERGLEEV